MGTELQHGFSAAALYQASEEIEKGIEGLELEPVRLHGAAREMSRLNEVFGTYVAEAKRQHDEKEITDEEFGVAIRVMRNCIGTVRAFEQDLAVRKERVAGELVGMKKSHAAVMVLHDQHRSKEEAAKANDGTTKRGFRNPPEKPDLKVVEIPDSKLFEQTYNWKQLSKMAKTMGLSGKGTKPEIVERILSSGQDIPKNGAAPQAS
jgi:hypothetical protein